MLVFDTLDHRKVGLQFRNAKTKGYNLSTTQDYPLYLNE